MKARKSNVRVTVINAVLYIAVIVADSNDTRDDEETVNDELMNWFKGKISF